MISGRFSRLRKHASGRPLRYPRLRRPEQAGRSYPQHPALWQQDSVPGRRGPRARLPARDPLTPRPPGLRVQVRQTRRSPQLPACALVAQTGLRPGAAELPMRGAPRPGYEGSQPIRGGLRHPRTRGCGRPRRAVNCALAHLTPRLGVRHPPVRTGRVPRRRPARSASSGAGRARGSGSPGRGRPDGRMLARQAGQGCHSTRSRRGPMSSARPAR